MQLQFASFPSASWLSYLRRQAPVILPILITAIFVLVPAMALADVAPDPGGTADPGAGVATGSHRICEMTKRLFEMIEGDFGSMIMVLGGILAVVSAAFGAYRSAVSLLVIAVGSFILRSLVDIFFNYNACAGGGGFPGFPGGFGG